MSADILQARYDQLDQVAARFAKAATNSAELQRSITRCVEVLERGGWIGHGADAFYAEMHGTLYPTMQRLVKALDQGRAVTLEAKAVLLAAEEEAAKLFRNQPQSSGTNQGIVGGQPQGFGMNPGSGESGNRISFSSGPLIGQTGVATFDAGFSGLKWPTLNPSNKKQGEGKIEEWESDNKSKQSKELGFKYGVIEGDSGSAYANTSFTVGPLKTASGITGAIGAYDAGAKVGMGKDGYTAGAYAEFQGVKIEGQQVIGSENLGLTKTYEVKAAAAEAFIGMKDNTIGAEIGFTLASIKEETGVNVAGVNVGVSAEVGLKWEFGFRIGQKVEAKLPFFSLGFSIGKAKTGRFEPE